MIVSAAAWIPWLLESPNEIAFHDVRPFTIRTVDDDARVIGVMDDIVSYDVVKAAVLDFDSITLADLRSVEIMNVVAFDHTVKDISCNGAVVLVVDA